MTPELLTLIKDVTPATDEEIDAWLEGKNLIRYAAVMSLIARIVAERKVVRTLQEKLEIQANIVCTTNQNLDRMSGEIIQMGSYIEKLEALVPHSQTNVAKFAALSALEEKG